MLFVKRLGSESCLRRWRGLLELCQRLPKLSELRAGGASIPLKRHCSSIICLLLGSFCPAHACVFWTHTRRSFASVQSRFETRPPWWFIYDTTDLLSERTSTWCPRMSGRKNWQAWHTASISRQLMCRPDSSSYQRLKVGFPSPQPLLEAYVVTTFLLCPGSHLALARRGPSNGPGLIHRPESPMWRPWCQSADGTLCKGTRSARCKLRNLQKKKKQCYNWKKQLEFRFFFFQLPQIISEFRENKMSEMKD